MVRAILAGRKTMTRRTRGLEKINHIPNIWKIIDVKNGAAKFKFCGVAYAPDMIIECPYGQPGDMLWVREAWGQDLEGEIFYKTDHHAKPSTLDRWRPSIYMPRWASRITLEITSVRVERVQEITPNDAVAEGVDEKTCDTGEHAGSSEWIDYRSGFIKLWDSINAKRGDGWDVNPFVWVLTFKRV
jgi:hypothetical protein